MGGGAGIAVSVSATFRNFVPDRTFWWVYYYLVEFGDFGANGAFLMHFDDFQAIPTLWPQKVPSG